MSDAISLLQMGVQGLDRTQARESLRVQDARILKNVRSFKGKLQTAPGLSEFTAAILAGVPLLAFQWETDDGDQQLSIHTTTKAFRFNGTTEVFDDITRFTVVPGDNDYTGGATAFWDAVAFNNETIFTNQIDAVQKAAPADANATDLAGSPPKARAVASFQTYLVLGGLPSLERQIQWGDTGSSILWATGDAGFLTLFQGAGPVLRTLPLGEVLVCYRSTSVHIMFFVGAPFIFGQRQLFSSGGLVAQRAVVDLGPRHVYWGEDNIYFFDGVNRQPVGDKIFTDLMSAVDQNQISKAAALLNITDTEVYFLAPSVGSTTLDIAFVLNYETGVWRREDGYNVSGVGVGKRFSELTWDNAVGSWDAQSVNWKEGRTTGADVPLMLKDAESPSFVDVTTVDIRGVARERIFESGLIDVGSALYQVPGVRVTLQRIKVQAENLGTVDVEVGVGTQTTLSGDSGLTFKTFTVNSSTPGTTSVRLSGNYFTFRFRTQGVGMPYRISGLVAYFVRRGDR